MHSSLDDPAARSRSSEEFPHVDRAFVRVARPAQHQAHDLVARARAVTEREDGRGTFIELHDTGPAVAIFRVQLCPSYAPSRREPHPLSTHWCFPFHARSYAAGCLRNA